MFFMILTEMIMELVLLGLLVFMAIFIWKYAVKWEMIKNRYLCLYELKKMQDNLKERGLTFEDLDELAKEISPKKSNKNALAKIDAAYEDAACDEDNTKKEKSTTKKGGASSLKDLDLIDLEELHGSDE